MRLWIATFTLPGQDEDQILSNSALRGLVADRRVYRRVAVRGLETFPACDSPDGPSKSYVSTTLRHTVRSDDIDTGSAVTVKALQIQLGWSRLAIAQNLDVTIVSGYA